MAGRQLQRLLKEQKTQALASKDDHNDSSGDSESDEEPSKPAFNPFDLLTDDEGEEESNGSNQSDGEDQGSLIDSEEEEEVAEENGAVLEAEVKVKASPPLAMDPSSPRSPSISLPSTSSKSAQNTCSRNKTKGRTLPSKMEKVDEDIDVILQELNITPQQAPQPSSSSHPRTSAISMLAVNTSHLKAQEELRKMFGSMGSIGVSSRDEQEAQQAAYVGASRRIRRLAARGLLRPAGAALRPGVLITPRSNQWPRPDGGLLSMKQIGTDDSGNPMFQLQYSHSYDIIQNLYEECQQSMDPNSIAALLQKSPYHLDSLLTMADVYRATGEHSYADDMIERCLYALEMNFPPSFLSAASTGSARVRYEEANIPLFVALFRYIQALGRRGLHRTGLEVCKLLMQLEREDDPMGVLQLIDYYSIRSGQYKYLAQFLEDENIKESASLLPNMVYSAALASWYESRKDSDNNNSSSSSSSKICEDLLVKAILLHPLVVVRLQKKLSEQGVGKDARWAEALHHPLFAQASDGENPGLGHLIDIFVERHHALWKASPIQEWLYGGVRRACGTDLPFGGLTAADWGAIRSEAFPPSETNSYNHLRLHEFSDAALRLPPEEIHGWGGGGGGDNDGANPHNLRPEELQALMQQVENEIAQGRGQGVDALRDTNPLVALLRSLMPWVADGQQPDYDNDDGADQHHHTHHTGDDA